MRIGLGMAALGRPGYINLERDAHLPSRTVDGMRRRAHEVIDELFRRCDALNARRRADDDEEGGKFVPWLDCARSYGLSEEFVGDYLRRNGVRPDDVVVSSKWGYTYVAGWNVELGEGEPHEVKDHSLENFPKQVEETKEHVGPYLDLYQVHSATFESGILSDAKVHEALHRVCRVENGWDIGLSVSGPNQDALIREALKITVPTNEEGKRRRLFDSVQCTCNVLEQRPAEALMEARAAGTDIIIKEALANGRALRHPGLLEAARETGREPDQIALGAVLAQPFRPRVLSGAATSVQLRSNMGAMFPDEAEENGRPLGVCDLFTSSSEGNEALQRLMEGCRMQSEEYWKERAELKWN